MKAKLLLEIDYDFDKEYEPENDEQVLSLLLVVSNGSRYEIYHSDYLDSGNYDNYLTNLEEILNHVSLVKNSIPGIVFSVDESVCEFIEGKEEEVKNYLKQLIVEI